MRKIPKIVLVGGPCGGKTQGVNFLYDKLDELGFDVFVINESAELLLLSGADRKDILWFQTDIAKNQLYLEEKIEKEAKEASNPVIICDRGLMDAGVYLSEDKFEVFKKNLNITDAELRDRYDAVFHMDSVNNADLYELNGVRNETLQQAQNLNERSLKVWCENPYFRVIPACKSFDKKLKMLLKEVKIFLKNNFNDNL